MPLSRTKQTGSALPIVIGVIVLIMAVGLYVGMKSDGASDLEPFPAKNYLESPGDFLGNTYALNAQIDSQLRWEKGVGRVLAVKVSGESTRIPVFVPDAIGANVHKGQRYELEVLIEEGGLIYVEALRKY
ncbi:MAG: hypothetical protein ACPGES_06840 [Coraliomargarita sp.]